MSNPNKIHYTRGYTSLGGITFNPKTVITGILVVFSLFAVYKYGQFASEKNYNMKTGEGRSGNPRVELLSWTPRVFYHHNFLSLDETEHLLSAGKNSSSFTSEPQATLTISSSTPTMDIIDKRIARFTQEPITHYEAGLLSKYPTGYESEPHRDWWSDEEADRKGTRGNRVATLIMFLTDSEGGDIAFSKVNLKVTPKAGDALLIWNFTPEHKLDELTYYGIKKITGSSLITFTRYIRERAA